MKNEVMNKPFPDNLFSDLGMTAPTEQAEDFLASMTYVLRCVSTPRDSKAILLRYKEGKTYDEIGEALGISKQRTNALIQSILDKINGEYALILQKGVKRYYDDLLNERIAHLDDVIADSEREMIKKKSFVEGYESGYKDGLFEKKSNGLNIGTLDFVAVATLPLSIRTYNALERNNIRTLGDVVQLGDRISAFRTFGEKCFNELAEILISYNVNVEMTFPKTCKKFDWRKPNE